MMIRASASHTRSFVFVIILVGIAVSSLWLYRNSDYRRAAISEAVVIGDPKNLTQRIVEKPDGTVQVVFSVAQDNLRFNDALNMTRDEFDALSNEQIQLMMWKRFQNWRIFTNQ